MKSKIKEPRFALLPTRGRLKFCQYHLDFVSITGFSELRQIFMMITDSVLELVSEELNHLAAILHVYAKGLIFMK